MCVRYGLIKYEKKSVCLELFYQKQISNQCLIVALKDASNVPEKIIKIIVHKMHSNYLFNLIKMTFSPPPLLLIYS